MTDVATRIWLVVPCYNEAVRLPSAAIETFLGDHPDVTICLVDDGSNDGTRAVLERVAGACPGQVVVLADRANTGKAEAVRQGVLRGAQSGAALFGYWDADLSTPLSELDLLSGAMVESPDRIAAIGSRVKRLGTNITRSLVRHYLGRVFATFASITLRLPVYDSQCGAKLFRRDAAEVAFADPFVSSWLFDVEVLARLRNHFGADGALRQILEVPLGEWKHVDGSKLKPRHYVAAPLELWRIARRYNR
jgi:dolichyl-phosphate beta-glucosyltransferase